MGGYYTGWITGSHDICLEQSEFNEEHVSLRYKTICPGLFEQLGPIQLNHKLFSAESKTDMCLVKYQGNKVSQSWKNSKRFAGL